MLYIICSSVLWYSEIFMDHPYVLEMWLSSYYFIVSSFISFVLSALFYYLAFICFFFFFFSVLWCDFQQFDVQDFITHLSSFCVFVLVSASRDSLPYICLFSGACVNPVILSSPHSLSLSLILSIYQSVCLPIYLSISLTNKNTHRAFFALTHKAKIKTRTVKNKQTRPKT